MELSPLLDVRQSPLRKLPVYLSRLNFHRNLEFSVDRMKVRWAMVSIVHGDNNSEKSAEFGHLLSYFGRICRLTFTMTSRELAAAPLANSLVDRAVRHHAYRSARSLLRSAEQAAPPRPSEVQYAAR
jgi:hypothetical protein